MRTDRAWKKRRAQIWVSAILYILITVVAVIIILEAGNPIVNGLRDRTAFSKTKDAMQVLDQYIIDVAEGGPGSQRVVPLEISTGNVYIDNESLRWRIETDSKLMEPRTKVDLGNIAVISSITNESLSATESEQVCYYILENSKLRVNITVFGNVSKQFQNCSSDVNTSNLINSIILKENNNPASGTFSFMIGNDSSSGYGLGSTSLVRSGTNLASSSIIVYVDSTKYDYAIELGLDSTSDFLTVKLISVKVK
ncbi:MAG: hypothetical protein NTZ02_01450 [Candidatus Woesearchaeota archaeon]|nr:hypothetical protein [Candidatus Woesearchaeota archaeon]